MYEARRTGVYPQGDEEEEEVGGDMDDLELEDEEEGAVRPSYRGKKRASVQDKASLLEPQAVERHYMQAADETIRNTDLPEEEQLTRGKDPDEFDLQVCAEWIWHKLFDASSPFTRARQILEIGAREVEGPPPKWMESDTWPIGSMRDGFLGVKGCRGFYLGRASFAEQTAWRSNPVAQTTLKESIAHALDLIYNKHEEVPFIAMYRKELLGELLAVSLEDQPDRDTALPADASWPKDAIHASERRIRRWDVLYAVQALSVQWRALQRLKEARIAAYKGVVDDAEDEEQREALVRCIQVGEQATTLEVRMFVNDTNKIYEKL